MDNQGQLVFAFDGDGIGIRHAKAILSDNISQVREVSEHITEGNDYIRQFVEQHGGQWVSGGGDEGSFTAPNEFVDLLEHLRKDYEYIVQATLSIGYGQTISQAGKALLAAKARGKNQVVQYDDSVQQEIENLEENKPSDEEAEKKKIKGALSESGQQSGQNPESGQQSGQVLPEGSDKAINEPTLCEPPKQDNNKGYDSGYKDSSKEVRGDSYQEQDLTPPIIAKPNLTPKPPVEEATSGDVPESSRPMNNEMPNPGEKEPMDKKPAPKDYHGQAEGDAPESIAQPNEHNPGDLKYTDHSESQPEADIPMEDATSDLAEETEQQDMLGEKHCPSCTCDAHQEGESMDEVLDQHIENASDYTNSIGEGGDGGNLGSSSSAEDVLDAHISNASEMNQDMDSEGVSRPADFNQKQTDLGLSEEDESDPNLDEVLRDGLDSHADSIQREKVIDMVGQALEAFKGQKKILDKAKEQAPELFDACIMMLRSMIELCSLAGIDQSEPEQEVNEIEGQGESPEEAPGAEEMPEEAPQEEQSEEECPNCGHPKEEKEQAVPGGAAKAPQL